MEQALLDGEWQAQREKLAQEEERLLALRLRLEQLDRDVATARLCEVRHLGDCRARLDAGETEAMRCVVICNSLKYSRILDS
jgi:type II secretory pathway component PulJ